MNIKLNKQLLVAGLITTVATGSMLGITAVNAQSDNIGMHDTLIDKISSRFNLNRDEVKAVFDEQHQEMEEKHRAERDTYLQTKVDDGTITAEQKALLIEKLDAMHETMESLRSQNATRQQIKEKMDSAREELQSWAEEQGIPINELKLMGKGMHGMGRRHGMMHGSEMSDHMTQ